MKQILQNLADGETSLVEVPCPKIKSDSLLIATKVSLLSSGTERMLVDFGKASYLEKARQQPDKVKQVLSKIKTDGLLATVDAVRSKLDQPLPLGYCNVGQVMDASCSGFEKGDRVVSNGYHAEVVCVKKNLCAKIPDEVNDESAAFTVVGAIGLQGIRLLAPTIGETVTVFGLGLIGLLSVQMLRANGCKVIGIDFDSDRCEMARQFGANVVDLSKQEDPVRVANTLSRGIGVDAVLITASTKSNDLIHQAAQMTRKRGRIVLVGVVGLDLRRDDFFQKEITFQVSASYGPGRYDPEYEEKGIDYPVGFVRWTEQRNFEAVLQLMASGSLDVKPLISHRFAIDDATSAYQTLLDKTAQGILLQYPGDNFSYLQQAKVALSKAPLDSHAAGHGNRMQSAAGSFIVGFIGAGNYGSRVLIPAFKKAGAQLDTLVSSGGVSSVHHGKKAGFKLASTDLEDIYRNAAIDTVAIVTQHNLHAAQVIEAVKSGKHVFVEKPLAITLEQIDAIEQAMQRKQTDNVASTKLMVGFNRRFSPLVVKMKQLLDTCREPKAMVFTVNAGAIDKDHWTQDIDVGGGRLIGEGCHFIDLMRFLTGCEITGSRAERLGQSEAGLEDKVMINLRFRDGSIGTINYLANGGKSFPKERFEVFCADAVFAIRQLQGT